jgi:type I restriction enzyme R subunit
VSFHESAVEEAALQWFESIGYVVAHGPDLLADGTAPERDETTVVLAGRLRSALERLDPGIPASAIDEAYKKLLHPEGSTLEAMNRSLHRMVVDGITVEFPAHGQFDRWRTAARVRPR